MAEVTVFVDAAVTGSLPPICVKTGCNTFDGLTIRHEIWGRSGLGIAWLLLLAGPLGWIGLFVVSVMHRPEGILTVKLPFSEEAHKQQQHARRARLGSGVITAISALVAFIAFLHGGFDGKLLAAIVGAATVMALLNWIREIRRYKRAGVDIELDASRRWVTLGRVHPNFIDAVERDREHSSLT